MESKPQFFAENCIRKNQQEFQHYSAVFHNRITRAFENLNDEAERIQADAYDRFASSNPSREEDNSGIAEAAYFEGVDFYLATDAIRQGVVNLMIAGLFHLLEQQSQYMATQVLSQPAIQSTGNDGFAQLESLLEKQYGIKIKSFKTGPLLDELRLVANVVKHAGGGSLEKLKVLNPDLFTDPQSGRISRLPIRPLVGEGLRLTANHFDAYKSCVEQFWQELTDALLPIFCPQSNAAPFLDQLPSQRLIDYAQKFFGYGRWEASIWFIGIEEGGGKDIQAVHDRLKAWATSGQSKELEDAPTFHLASNITAWHRPDAKHQSTWKQLIRMFLLARGQDDSEDALIDYQRTQLGTTTGETCLAELLPLPSPDSKTWNYRAWSELPWLQTRAAYEQNILSHRITLLRQRIDHYRPRIVIFYGDGQLKHWQRIIGSGIYQRPIADKLIAHERDGLQFFITKHPTNPNLRPHTDNYFREIGRFFHNNHGARFLPKR